MRYILVLAFLSTGCDIPAEDCYETNKIIDYKTVETEFYTISEPQYEWACTQA